VDLNEKIAARDAALQLKEDDVRKANSRYYAAVRAGAVRLSVPVTHCSAAPSADPPTPGVVQETRAELDPEAAITLDRIASDGDEAIRELNALIDLYNELREKLNGEH
jgi:prophage endopeptidase